MQAECPYCHTLFRITEAQLDMADGMARCGYCKKVFNARIGNDLQSDEDRLHAFEDTSRKDTQQPERSRQIEAENESFFSGEPDDIAPDEFMTVSGARHYSMLATVSWSLAILFLIAALAAEYIWFNQPELMLNPSLEPVTTKLCELTDCQHLQMRDPSKIEMVSRNVYTHPNEKKALMISTTLVNNASYAQPYPDVQIDFSNVRGELVASRRFTPEEYLQTGNEQLSLLQTGNPATFGLEIVDPGKEAITYEFSFH
jgi:predicted Zn finger-like uncharacterized protein